MNSTRVAWIDERIRVNFFDQKASGRVLDIGCGAGLLTEALARRGYAMLGMDAAPEAIAAAKAHAMAHGLSIDYRVGKAEELLHSGERFSVVTALEVIEHVPVANRLLRVLATLVAPGGLLFISTLNRTRLAFLTAKFGAEYVLRLLPVGTHDWRKFVSPAELGAGLRLAGMHMSDIAGMQPDPLRGGWRICRSVAVNYIAMARK